MAQNQGPKPINSGILGLVHARHHDVAVYRSIFVICRYAVSFGSSWTKATMSRISLSSWVFTHASMAVILTRTYSACRWSGNAALEYHTYSQVAPLNRRGRNVAFASRTPRLSRLSRQQMPSNWIGACNPEPRRASYVGEYARVPPLGLCISLGTGKRAA